MESMGEWSWPGRGGAAVEFLPPPWVPSFPPRLESAVSDPSSATPWKSDRANRRRLALGAFLSALAAICVAVTLNGPLELERLLGVRAASDSSVETATIRSNLPPLALPTLTAVSEDAAGSSIDAASYSSASLHGRGSFLVYLPHGYASTTRHYPVLYLLHGNNQPDTAFLQIGLQGTLDRLIARHVIPPLIAVMIQGGRGANNWRNIGSQHYESYVLEVQQLIDRMLPTVAARGARAIAGDSMGGYGAMNVALGNPYRFSVVESWLGFFNGLGDELHADRPVLSRLGLSAFVYGGASDDIADPSENAPFAAALRAAGARARGVVYPGEHSLETIQAHLESMLTFAGGALRENMGAGRRLAQHATRPAGVLAGG
jgi:S-formylglutathione hydrolase FrmB